MDIERGILKALFYDYPVENVRDLLSNRLRNHKENAFLDILPQLLEWRKDEYTYTEANLLRLKLNGEWLPDSILHPFDMLSDATCELLSLEHNKVLVQFDRLFRWKDLALFLGEDMLVASFYATMDVRHKNEEQKGPFVWSDIIHHNNQALNDILNRGLADVHAHYNANADVWALNWIELANNVTLRNKLKKLTRTQDVELITPRGQQLCSYDQCCIAAAYLRFVFYVYLLCPNNHYANSIEDDYQHKVIKILDDEAFAIKIAKDLQSSIEEAKTHSVYTNLDENVDYCITHVNLIKDDLRNANLIFHGERSLLYHYFYGYYSSNRFYRESAAYFYLYLLLKNKIRREFVQINTIKGFENFQTYQYRKDLLFDSASKLHKYYASIAYQTSVNSSHDYLEMRITPSKSNLENQYKIDETIFDRRELVYRFEDHDSKPSRIGFTCHFLKKGYDAHSATKNKDLYIVHDGTRDEKYRDNIKKQIEKVLNHKVLNAEPCVVGIDAASSEIFCRPEVFGHVYRYARFKGLQELTYHVGEDFLDLSDGLRAIDEAVLFLNLDDKCRIGHALALGIDAKKYYTRRHYTTIITQQNLLDNCVWLYMRSLDFNVEMSPSFAKGLRELAKEIYDDIKYTEAWDIQKYWHSMLMRGNDPIAYQSSNPMWFASPWEITMINEDKRLNVTKCDEEALNLYQEYFYPANEEMMKRGMKLVQHKWDTEIVSVVEQLQEAMQKMISDKGIAIECCPTSNLKIGYIDQYDEHPMITKFYPVIMKPSYPVIECSINTDDRGVFYTSIYEEYSLIALALKKMKDKEGNRLYNDMTIREYIERIRQSSWQMTFDQKLHSCG